MLQVGIVIAQPSPVLPDGQHHHDHKHDAEQEEIDFQQQDEGIAAVDHRDDQNGHSGHHRHEERPQRAPTVLKHHQQHRHHRGHQRHAVQPGPHNDRQPWIANHLEATQQRPPHMAQGHQHKEGRHPSAQAQGWRDLGRNGIAATKQQIGPRNEGQ